MERFNIKFLRSLLMAVCILCASFFTAHAQYGASFLSPEFQCVSEATFDQSGNPTDSTVYLYTKKGYPFGKEAYSWDSYSKQRTLASTTKIISDTGNDFTAEVSMYDENGLDEITQMAFNCNDAGDLLKMESTSMLQMPGLSTVTTIQYWRTGNRLDSTLSTMTMASYGFTSLTKTIYRTYDADGRPTLEEMYSSSSMGSISLGPDTRSVYTFAYFKNASGKLEREEDESDLYNSDGTLNSVTKDITYFDSSERPIRTDEYFGPTLTLAMMEIDSYTIYHYDGQAGIVNPALPVQPIIANVVDGSLSVNSSKAERIEIYSVSGVQVYANAKPAGEIQISIDNLPKGIYLVKGSSGWVKKIIR